MLKNDEEEEHVQRRFCSNGYVSHSSPDVIKSQEEEKEGEEGTRGPRLAHQSHATASNS